MTLRVNQVLHHEKSKYQDILIFESTDHGAVLVLDNVIQCTERDEFSYQEMITHLAMHSHPNPKKVLVIGGGDGGVLREVIKHESVEEATLCDIDEAVIRLSKKYLPGMAVGFQHPKVKTHVGDGFKFLANCQDEFDVIITDSSDPEGPAETLFQKPYFELLHAALREGGVVTTQAESIWLHLSFIENLVKTCQSVFPVVGYAYTSTPTYPSGQIGFMVCCKQSAAAAKSSSDAEDQQAQSQQQQQPSQSTSTLSAASTNVAAVPRDITKPLRWWDEQTEAKLCKYYNRRVHEASFVLPTFAREALR